MQAARGLTFLSKNPSFSYSKNVFCKISNAIRGSNTQWRGRAFAASVPSESSNSRKGQKRISKDERRAMVEIFVDNYRALNAGKYPTPTETRKQVGGSYYVVKKIVQELEYRSKSSSISRVDQHLLDNEIPKREDRVLTKVEQVSSIESTVDIKCHEVRSKVKDKSPTIIIEDNLEEKEEPQVSTHVEKPLSGEFVNDESSAKIINNDFEAKEKPQVSSHVKKSLTGGGVNPKRRGDDSNFSQTFSDQIGPESNVVLHSHIEKPNDSGKEAAISEGSQDLNGQKEEVVLEVGQQYLESDKLARAISSKEESKEDQVPEKSTFWGNLRSFADGIINLWKKN